MLQGELVVSGVEVGTNGNITPRWQLFGSYTYMDSEITRSNNAAEVGREFTNSPIIRPVSGRPTGCRAVWSSGAEHSM